MAKSSNGVENVDAERVGRGESSESPEGPAMGPVSSDAPSSSPCGLRDGF